MKSEIQVTKCIVDSTEKKIIVGNSKLPLFHNQRVATVLASRRSSNHSTTEKNQSSDLSPIRRFTSPTKINKPVDSVEAVLPNDNKVTATKSKILQVIRVAWWGVELTRGTP